MAPNEHVVTMPSVNIADRSSSFELTIAIPELEKKDVKLELQGRCLIIASYKQYEVFEHSTEWLCREYGYASFQRMFSLPPDADAENIHAQMKNGILKVRIAKLKKSIKDQSKQVLIK